jgi:PPOX class probable F420-dependent enzyme
MARQSDGMDALFRATGNWLGPSNPSRPAARPDAATEARLSAERTVWVGTTGPSGGPAVVPIWFTWTGLEFLIFAKPAQRKVRNIRREPRVMLALGDPEDDFDVQLVEGQARLLDRSTAEMLPPEHRLRYASELARLGMDWDAYAAAYSQPIAVTPTRFLPWRGRTPRAEQLRASPVLKPL